MSEQATTSQLTLAQAVERYRADSGAASNAYEWYRKQAYRDGRVWLGGGHVTAIKVGRQWMVDEAEVADALTAHRAEMAKKRRDTVDYENHILHGGDGTTVEADWGGYKISGLFQFRLELVRDRYEEE